MSQQYGAANRAYEDFQPPHDWDQDQQSYTLVLPLEGFRREQLRVQITSSRVLVVSGERQIDEQRWRRFRKELNIPSDSDANDIRARFERGTLYVKFLKLIKNELASKPQPAMAPPPPPSAPPTQKVSEEEEALAASSSKPKRDEGKEEETIKEKEQPSDDDKIKKDVSRGKGLVEEETKAEAKNFETLEEKHQVSDHRMPSSSSMSLCNLSQTQNFKDAIVGLVGEIRKQRKLANLLLAIIMIMLLLIYVKNLIKSSLGGSKTQEL